ncbi:hypothetical protein COOONC_04269 [Cooperia oncophora]
MALTDTYGTYQKEMEKACNDGRKAAERFQKNLPKMMNEVQPWMKEMMRAIADMSKVSAPQRLVIEVFAWSGVLVLSCSLGSVLGAYILNSVFASMISKFTASVLAYFVIPVAIHASIKHVSFTPCQHSIPIKAIAFLQGSSLWETIPRLGAVYRIGSALERLTDCNRI